MRKINRVKVNTTLLAFDFLEEPSKMSTVDISDPKPAVRKGLVRGIKQVTLWESNDNRIIGEMDGLRITQKNIDGKWVDWMLPERVALEAFTELYNKR